uniref:Uncharacterized protein MANES_13G128700 n=1 Tax=Rhizophora mucronata TaxID=61149 RepID=A0A2P2MXH4_RHIMU
MTHITRNHRGPRKTIPFGHFIKQFPSFFKRPTFCIPRNQNIPRTQIPFCHFIKQLLGAHYAITLCIHFEKPIRNKQTGYEPR